MMTALLLLFFSSAVCFYLVFVPYVAGVTVKGETYDLSVHTVSREWLDEGSVEEWKIRVTVNFTASICPQTLWTYADSHGGSVEVADTELTFSGGRGEARATMDIGVRLVTLRIGYFDSHSLILFIKRDFPIDTSQTLNTRLSSVSPGYDVTYDPDEAFQVTAVIPKHIADDFTWSHFMDDPQREYNVRLAAAFVDQKSGGVLDSVDSIADPNMSKFLQNFATDNPLVAVGSFTVPRLWDEDAARWQLNFTTAHVDVSGYFRFFTLSSYNNFSWLDEGATSGFVVEIWEVVDVKIHNASTPGPFPVHFAAVETYPSYESCEEGEKCYLYCYGFANNITRVSIFKEDTGESVEHMYTNVRNSNHVNFRTRFVASGDYTGNYVCQVDAADGTTSRKIVEVISG